MRGSGDRRRMKQVYSSSERTRPTEYGRMNGGQGSEIELVIFGAKVSLACSLWWISGDHRCRQRSAGLNRACIVELVQLSRDTVWMRVSVVRISNGLNIWLLFSNIICLGILWISINHWWILSYGPQIILSPPSGCTILRRLCCRVLEGSNENSHRASRQIWSTKIDRSLAFWR